MDQQEKGQDWQAGEREREKNQQACERERDQQEKGRDWHWVRGRGTGKHRIKEPVGEREVPACMHTREEPEGKRECLAGKAQQ